MKKDNYVNKTLGTAFKLIFGILKWLTLVVSMVFFVYGAVLIIVSLVNGSQNKIDLVSKIISQLTVYKASNVIDFINKIGMTKVVVCSSIAFISSSIALFAQYIVMRNILKIYDEIVKGKVFKDENVKLVNKTLAISFLATFIQPIMVTISTFISSMYSGRDYNISGIVYILIVFVLKLVIEQGYELDTKLKLAKDNLAEEKISSSELKASLIKQTDMISSLEEYKNKSEEKIAKDKAKKLAEAKAKRQAAKKEKEAAKKVATKPAAAKKTITKKTATKKTTKK